MKDQIRRDLTSVKHMLDVMAQDMNENKDMVTYVMLKKMEQVCVSTLAQLMDVCEGEAAYMMLVEEEQVQQYRREKLGMRN